MMQAADSPDNSTPAQKPDLQDKLLRLFLALEGVSEKLLAVKPGADYLQFNTLVEDRNKLGQAIFQLCQNPANRSSLQTLRADVQAQANKLIEIDRQLLDYLSLEVQKLQGRHSRKAWELRQQFQIGNTHNFAGIEHSTQIETSNLGHL